MIRTLTGECGKDGIRAISSSAKMLELSGGNQQKVVIAKSLVQKPRLIIFNEPTRGVDVGSIVEIHQFINRLADSGIAVVLISSYLPEIMSLSDRILLARQGQVVEEMNARGATEGGLGVGTMYMRSMASCLWNGAYWRSSAISSTRTPCCP